ncbi:MAG: transporter [Terriglobales bacterium]
MFLTRMWRITCRIVAVAALLHLASATENGGSVYPVGVETVLTGLQPRPGQTTLYEYTCFYMANEFDDSKGKSAIPEFKLRVFANAVKVTHNWGIHFLGGTVESQIGVPFVYEQLRIQAGKFSEFGLTNMNLIPISVTYQKAHLHWYYEADMFTSGAGYAAAHVVNIGQHSQAIAPVAGFTYLPRQGKGEISSRFTYIFNGYDRDTHYHSGNEFMWEYNAAYEISKKVAAGFNGYFYQQTTNDSLKGAVFQGGFLGRDLAVGPQLRFPLGKHGGFAVKYYRDTLVENKPRGNGFWFQMSVAIGKRTP